MYKNIFLYSLFSLIFISGSIYNFKSGGKSLYRTRLTKLKLTIILITPVIFLSIAYFTGDSKWPNYIFAGLGAIFVISPIFGEGINERGIYHLAIGTRSSFVRLTKWEDIRGYELNREKGKLERIKLRDRNLYPGQYYRLKNIDEITSYIDKKIN